MKKNKSSALKKSVLLSALLIEITTGAHAATINVDGTTCTLSDAITAANSDAVAGGCTAGSGDDVIELPLGSTQTFSSAPPEITSNVTINANSSTIERDSVDYFVVLSSSLGGSLTLNDATVTGGQGDPAQNLGGGLSAYDSQLIVNNSIVSGNTGGAVRLISPVASSITNSVIENNQGISGSSYYTGGVSVNGGVLDITNSTISNNTADSAYAGGGGVYLTDFSSAVTVGITNSTITGNTSTLPGGGIGSYGFGVGITLNLSNVTVVLNESSGNGGGIANDLATINISQSLVSGNTGTAGAEINSTGGTITVDDYNLFGLNSASGVVGVTVGATDIVPAEATLAEIIDVSLVDNGGPTPTHALAVGSPAIDAVPAANCASATDQTGKARPLDGDNDTVADCDIGAFENEAATNSDIIFEDGFE